MTPFLLPLVALVLLYLIAQAFMRLGPARVLVAVTVLLCVGFTLHARAQTDSVDAGVTATDTAPANAIVPTDAASPEQLESYAATLLNAAHAPDKSLFIALILIAVVYAVRRWGATLAGVAGLPKVVAFLTGDRGGAVTTLILAVLGGIATALAAGQHVSIPLIITGLGIGVKAIGGYVGFRKILGIKSEPAPTTATSGA